MHYLVAPKSRIRAVLIAIDLRLKHACCQSQLQHPDVFSTQLCSLVSKQPYQDVSIGLQTVPLVLSSAPQNGHESYANESITQNYISLAFGHVSPKPTTVLDSNAHAMSHLASNYAVLYSATTITSLHGSVGASITPIAKLHLTGENVEGRKIIIG